MYFANPIVFFAGVMLLLTLLTLLWRRLSRTEPMRDAAAALMRVSLTWCAVMLVLGMIMGLNHAGAHPNCQRARAANPDALGCDYFIAQYGK
jgi:nitrate reductase gamma subunit